MKVTFGKSVMQVVNFQRVPALFILLSAHSLARKRLNKYAFKKIFKLDGCFKLEVQGKMSKERQITYYVLLYCLQNLISFTTSDNCNIGK